MKKTAICILLLCLVVASCSEDKKQMILGNWHAVKLQNADMDSFYARSQHYIDTMGKGHDDSTNIHIYGAANVDSLRKVLQSQYDSARVMQNVAISNTFFDFNKNGTVTLSFNGIVDSSMWMFDSTGALVLDDLNGKNGDGRVKMDVVSLTKTELKLKFVENTTVSTVTFRHEGKGGK